MPSHGTTHYSWAQEPENLSRWAAEYAIDLFKMLECSEPATPVFCYRGMSGCAHATALSLAWHGLIHKPFGMIYVRKPGEDSHGSDDYEHALKQVIGPTILVFVDEQVSSGNTRRETLRRARACIDATNLQRNREREWEEIAVEPMLVTERCFSVLKYEIESHELSNLIYIGSY